MSDDNAPRRPAQRADTVEPLAAAGGAAQGAGTPNTAPAARPGTKTALVIDLLLRPGGATLADIREATGWQPHTVRGAIAGSISRRLGLKVIGEKAEGEPRRYRIDN